MAGIGFELQKLSAKNSISSKLSATTHGAMIATGPWLFTIASLGIIALATQNVEDREALATFRVLVFYGFCLSLIISSPAIITGVRLVADAIYAKQVEKVSTIFLLCAFFSALPVTIAAFIIYFWFFPLPLFAGLAAVAMCVMTSLIWVATAFCSAIRDYRVVTSAFSVGMSAVTINAIILAQFGQGAEGMLVGMNVGLSTIVVLLFNRIFVTFPHAVKLSNRNPFWFLNEMAKRSLLCFGALASNLAIWVDKFILWNSQSSETVQWGLKHSPIYDSALFISFLCIIPALSQYVIHIETDFYRKYQKYYNDISEHACLREIDENAKDIQSTTIRSVFDIWHRHAVICGVFFLLGPLIVTLVGLEFRQLSIYRLGVLGVLFHFLFFACSSIIIFLDRQRIFLALQLLFLATNFAFTTLSLYGGQDYYGSGYFAACLICAVLSYVAMMRVFSSMNYLTFIANNKL